MTELDSKRNTSTDTRIIGANPQKTLLLVESNQEYTSMEIDNIIETIEGEGVIIKSKLFQRNFNVTLVREKSEIKEKLNFETSEVAIYHIPNDPNTINDLVEVNNSLNKLIIQLNIGLPGDEDAESTICYIYLVCLNLLYLQHLLSKDEIIQEPTNIDIIENYVYQFHDSIAVPIRKNQDESNKQRLHEQSKQALTLFRGVKHTILEKRG